MPFLDNSVTPSSNLATSINAPNNPQLGDMWNELDNDNNLVQQWSYLTIEDSPRWCSQLQHYSWGITMGSTGTFYLINPAFDIFVKEYYIHIFSVSQTIVAGEFFNRRLMLGSQGGGNVELLGNGNFTSLSANNHEYIEVPVNILIPGMKYRGIVSATVKNLINTSIISNKAVNTFSSISTVPTFTYQLVRK